MATEGNTRRNSHGSLAMSNIASLTAPAEPVFGDWPSGPGVYCDMSIWKISTMAMMAAYMATMKPAITTPQPSGVRRGQLRFSTSWRTPPRLPASQ